jgi:anthranilate synthase component 1
MFSTLPKEDFQNQMRCSKRVAVYKEFPCDCTTPVKAYQAIAQTYPHSALLESSEGTDRYSFIGFAPLCRFESNGNTIQLTENDTTQIIQADPMNTLRRLKNEYLCNTSLPSSFMGEAIGFASYDSIRLFENIPARHPNSEHFPDLLFNFYKGGIAFDHKKELLLISYISSQEEGYDEALEKINTIHKQIQTFQESTLLGDSSKKEFHVDLDDSEFCELILKAKKYIKEGDVFQVVLSRQFEKDFQGNPFDIYRALRIVNPSPYLFYLDCGGYQIAGASPEQLVGLKDGILHSKPLAGTRKRGRTNEEDQALERELLHDEKEIAEHTMLLDLGRNDVGAISEVGSVRIVKNTGVVRYSQVMHLESHIQGKLEKDKDALDALQATFPAGTLSGAPKIRAMEIIDELENSRRNLYGGGIITLNSSGDMNSCIAIRMAVVHNGKVSVRAGCGVVHDSDPQKEAEETKNKALAVLNAIQLAEKGSL